MLRLFNDKTIYLEGRHFRENKFMREVLFAEFNLGNLGSFWEIKFRETRQNLSLPRKLFFLSFQLILRLEIWKSAKLNSVKLANFNAYMEIISSFKELDK